MHMDIYQTGEPTAEVLVSKNTLRELDLRRPAMSALPQVPSPRNCALRGLIVAVPMSLSLWAILGLAVWVILR